MRIILFVLFLLTVSVAHADVIRPQCQTEESKRLHYVADGLFEVASKHSGGISYWQQNGATYSNVQSSAGISSTSIKIEAESDQVKARAIEAVQCPWLKDVILHNWPLPEDRDLIDEKYKDELVKLDKDIEAKKAWQQEHPQCKEVSIPSGGWSTPGPPDDLSGKNGKCVIMPYSISYPDDRVGQNFDFDEYRAIEKRKACKTAATKAGFSDTSKWACEQ